MTAMRVGTGFDVHRLDEPGTASHITLGGTRIAFDRRIVAHSDGDVLVHALMDAMVGAVALGDIGYQFPDTDARWAGANSITLLEHTRDLLTDAGFAVVNCDTTLIAERPKLKPHVDSMRGAIAAALGIDRGAVGVKATTSERLGFVGREEGIAAQAVVLLDAS